MRFDSGRIVLPDFDRRQRRSTRLVLHKRVQRAQTAKIYKELLPFHAEKIILEQARRIGMRRGDKNRRRLNNRRRPLGGIDDLDRT
ncbi:MAG: hypothetical protein WCF55_06050, partial [Pseudolabrys sp.]